MFAGISRNKIFTGVALAAVIALGIFLHFFNISYPPRPVFDEAHFATYAADYVEHTPFFDIHPPLGKLIYAAALSFVATPQNLKNAGFVTFVTVEGQKGAGLGVVVTIDNHLPFNNFPYLPLRYVSAGFGVFLALAFFWFLKNIGASDVAAFLGALFVTFENALLLETRLVLINGIYLTLGFAALALYFKKPRWPLAAGAVFGLALGVKIMSIVFAGPLLACYLAKKRTGEGREEAKHIKKYIVAAALMFFLVFSVNFIIFTPMEHLDVLKSLGVISYTSSPRLPYLLAPIADAIVSFGGYVSGNPHLLQSPWYFWLAMQVPMTYFYEIAANHLRQIVLAGNPVVWYSSTLAAICALTVLPRYLRKFFHTRNFEDNKSFFILLAGYLSALLPFATVIRRSTFLYHYFPALMFAIGLLAWFIVKALKIGDWDTLNIRQVLALAVVVILSFAGFLYTAPLTYGL